MDVLWYEVRWQYQLKLTILLCGGSALQSACWLWKNTQEVNLEKKLRVHLRGSEGSADRLDPSRNICCFCTGWALIWKVSYVSSTAALLPLHCVWKWSCSRVDASLSSVALPALPSISNVMANTVVSCEFTPLTKSLGERGHVLAFYFSEKSGSSVEASVKIKIYDPSIHP